MGTEKPDSKAGMKRRAKLLEPAIVAEQFENRRELAEWRRQRRETQGYGAMICPLNGEPCGPCMADKRCLAS